MPRQASNLTQLSHVLYRHEWNTAEEWADNIYKLGELTDHEIDKLEHLASPEVYGP